MDWVESRAFIDRIYEVESKLEEGETVVLTENDKKLSKEQIKESNDSKNFMATKRPFEKLEDYMLVHKTQYAPQNSIIETRMSGNVVDKTMVPIGDKFYEINVRPCRNTVHFSSNHEVRGNSGGNWDNCKYAVVTPLVSIPKEQFRSNKSVDTFVEGRVSLKSGSYILCPKEEMETIKMKNPGIIIVGYDGENVLDYANTLLWMLGYPVVYGDDWGIDSYHDKSYHEVLEKAGFKNFDAHTYTDMANVENANWCISYAVGILELIANNSEFANIDSRELVEQSGLFKTLCYCDAATPGYLNNLLDEIGMKKSFVGPFADDEEFDKYCIALIDEAKILCANRGSRH